MEEIEAKLLAQQLNGVALFSEKFQYWIVETNLTVPEISEILQQEGINISCIKE